MNEDEDLDAAFHREDVIAAIACCIASVVMLLVGLAAWHA